MSLPMWIGCILEAMFNRAMFNRLFCWLKWSDEGWFQVRIIWSYSVLESEIGVLILIKAENILEIR